MTRVLEFVAAIRDCSSGPSTEDGGKGSHSRVHSCACSNIAFQPRRNFELLRTPCRWFDDSNARDRASRPMRQAGTVAPQSVATTRPRAFPHCLAWPRHAAPHDASHQRGPAKCWSPDERFALPGSIFLHLGPLHLGSNDEPLDWVRPVPQAAALCDGRCWRDIISVLRCCCPPSGLEAIIRYSMSKQGHAS